MKIDWRIENNLIPYPLAVAQMEERVANIRVGKVPEMVWLLEHPPLYTAGTSARPEDLLGYHDIPVFQAGRGGQFTYHGPGQRIAYVMLDLTKRENDVRKFVFHLEEWIIRTLAHFNIRGERRLGRVGVWVNRGQKREDKIAAIGIRVRRGVTYHGVAVNLSPNLDHYQGIIPCGIQSSPSEQLGVTSFADLGIHISIADFDRIFREKFDHLFNLSGE